MTICLKLLVIILLGTVKERKQRSGFPHSSYYSINCGKVDLIKQLPVRASPILFMTEATSMLRVGNLNDIAWLYVAKDN